MSAGGTDGRVCERLREVRRRLLGMANVTGVGIGMKEMRGRVTNLPAWRVYVRAKRPLQVLAGCDRIPRSCEGLATDVVLAGIARRTLRLDEAGDSLAPGAAITNLRGQVGDGRPPERPNSGLGTLGFFARVNGVRSRDVVLVSNRHVLMAHDARGGAAIFAPDFARCGESWAIRGGALAPIANITDEGAEGNHLFCYHDQPGEYFVDCAAARLLIDLTAYQRLRGSGRDAKLQFPALRVKRLHPLDAVGGRTPAVCKIGAASGVTFGRVVDAAAPVETVGGPRRCQNIAIRGTNGAFVEQGDSGALLLNDRDEAVGMIWGRDDRDPRVAYASHIHPVLDRLNLTMMTRGFS